ncbi:MAG: hypothetical protein MI974_19130 [Chitinophagales bacterium]|nr:hypothetical protein [Chitinophagales bacterium]
MQKLKHYLSTKFNKVATGLTITTALGILSVIAGVAMHENQPELSRMMLDYGTITAFAGLGCLIAMMSGKTYSVLTKKQSNQLEHLKP